MTHEPKKKRKNPWDAIAHYDAQLAADDEQRRFEQAQLAQQQAATPPTHDASDAFMKSQMEFERIRRHAQEEFTAEEENKFKKAMRERIRAEARRDFQRELEEANRVEWMAGLEALTVKLREDLRRRFPEDLETELKKQWDKEQEHEVGRLKREAWGWRERYERLVAEVGKVKVQEKTPDRETKGGGSAMPVQAKIEDRERSGSQFMLHVQARVEGSEMAPERERRGGHHTPPVQAKFEHREDSRHHYTPPARVKALDEKKAVFVMDDLGDD